jgi:hypothetical protein
MFRARAMNAEVRKKRSSEKAIIITCEVMIW